MDERLDAYKRIFSRNLKKFMGVNGKTQVDIIKDLGFNKSAVSTWCNGTRLPRMDKVDMLARYFGIKRSDLIEDKDAESDHDIIIKRLIEYFELLNETGQKEALNRLQEMASLSKFAEGK